jgi:hypothetical protein
MENATIYKQPQPVLRLTDSLEEMLREDLVMCAHTALMFKNSEKTKDAFTHINKLGTLLGLKINLNPNPQPTH